MKTINEIRAAEKELEPVEWGILPDPYMKPSEKTGTKTRTSLIDWIFVGIMGYMIVRISLEILERFLWLLK